MLLRRKGHGEEGAANGRRVLGLGVWSITFMPRIVRMTREMVKGNGMMEKRKCSDGEKFKTSVRWLCCLLKKQL